MAKQKDIASSILAFLERFPNEQFKMKELGRRLGYRAGREYEAFKHALFQLKDDGKILPLRGKMYQHLHVPQYITGKLRLTRQGFGFVIPDDGSEDVFIAGRDKGHATHGDVVEVALFMEREGKKGEEDKREGEVVRIVERGRTEIVGTLERVRKTLFVVPDDIRVASSVYISNEDAGEAVPGQKVAVAIESWGEEHFQPVGKVIDILGEAGQVGAEILSVIREYQLPMEFPEPVLAEADAFPEEIPSKTIAARTDLRSLLCVTIDPEDAKDFDDALSIERLDNGSIMLGVHIADVSAYVTEGSELDQEALRRGTSVYFPNSVIPMLPERLSGHLCSLRPDEDKLAYSVFLTLSPRGVVKKFEVSETVIRSKRRFTYEQVEKIIEGDASARKREAPDVIQAVDDLHALSGLLTKKRMKEGSIDFDSPEARFTFDADGHPASIERKTRLASHRLVEECMLLANRIVAKECGFSEKEEGLRPFLFRVHDLPDPGKIRELATFVKTFGYNLQATGNFQSKDFQKLLASVKGSEVENLINEVAIRSMAKAEYTPKNIGHFGLAFDTYTHYTSPIRRYPDLVVHRLMKEYAQGMTHARREHHANMLQGIAQHASDRERVSLEAERTSLKVMQVSFMQRHVGDEFPAVISGVTRFGLFVEIDELLVEGMVHVRHLDDDYYTYDEATYTLTGRRSGHEYRLGDRLDVQVVKVNPEDRQIDFRIVTRTRPKKKKPVARQKKRKRR
jgi:ribonuclease R